MSHFSRLLSCEANPGDHATGAKCNFSVHVSSGKPVSETRSLLFLKKVRYLYMRSMRGFLAASVFLSAFPTAVLFQALL
jgi:hypothetical protein